MLSELKKAVVAEVALWMADPIVKQAIIKARKTTGEAASKLVAAADSLKMKVGENLRALSLQSGLKESKTAVDATEAMITAKKWTKAQLRAHLEKELAPNLSSGAENTDRTQTKPKEEAQSPAPAATEPATPVGEFYSDIVDILSSIGEGLSTAQRNMDMSALETQKEIMDSDELSGYGLTANWYVMPEAEFTMKMELGVYTEEKTEGTLNSAPQRKVKTRIMAALSNAKYNNLYKTDSRQESTLRVKFVPVPMPAVVRIPEIVGLPVATASEELLKSSVNALFTGADGKIWNRDDGTVASQSMKGVMLAEKTLQVTVEGPSGGGK